MSLAAGPKPSHLKLVSLDEQLTVRELAALLKVSTATVYKLCDAGTLPHFRVLNSIRFSRAAVSAWMEVNTQT